MSAPFREAWPKLGCAFDDFIRTTEPRHEKWAAELWRRVKANGDLYLGAYEGWYCVGCEAYYTEKELVEPGNLCPVHKTPAERIREPTYFFKLKSYGERLLAFYEKYPAFVSPTSRMNEVKSFVRGGLEDLSVSRTTFQWGIPVPDDESHVMYVWSTRSATTGQRSRRIRSFTASGRPTCTSSARTSSANTRCTGPRSSCRRASPTTSSRSRCSPTDF